MNHSRSIGMALLIALLLAFLGEWWGFGAMVAVAIFETYREYKNRRMFYELWKLQNLLEDFEESSERTEQ